VLLMDEPLSILDACLRVRTRTEIKRLQRDLGITSVFVTHDQEEAMVLSDRIVMMTNGPAATIGEDLRVDLERPRKRLELVGNSTYNDARAAVLEFLYARHRAPTLAA